MAKHALLSPSSAHMWLNCPPSARLSAQFEDTGSEYAQQGTDAHSLCQYKVKKALGREVKDPTEDLTFYDAEMEGCAEDYATFVAETISKVKETCPDPVVLIEQRLDFSRYVPDGYGFGDCIIIADGTMHIIDFKYGLGVLVSAEANPQMMCYSLGALELLDGLYDIDAVSMTIFQPRRDNVSTYTISRDELLHWAEETLSPTAKLAAEGKGEYKAGDHCRFCKAKAMCRKHAEYNLELAKYDFAGNLRNGHTVLEQFESAPLYGRKLREHCLAILGELLLHECLFRIVRSGEVILALVVHVIERERRVIAVALVAGVLSPTAVHDKCPDLLGHLDLGYSAVREFVGDFHIVPFPLEAAPGGRDTKRAGGHDGHTGRQHLREGMTKHGGYIEFKKSLLDFSDLYVSRRL